MPGNRCPGRTWMWQGLWRTVIRQRLPNIFWCPRRCVSTAYLDPSLRSFASSLVREQPVFELPPSSIQILSEPSQFYKTLLVSIIQIQIYSQSFMKFCRTWLDELNAEFSSPLSTLVHRSQSLCVIFFFLSFVNSMVQQQQHRFLHWRIVFGKILIWISIFYLIWTVARVRVHHPQQRYWSLYCANFHRVYIFQCFKVLVYGGFSPN